MVYMDEFDKQVGLYLLQEYTTDIRFQSSIDPVLSIVSKYIVIRKNDSYFPFSVTTHPQALSVSHPIHFSLFVLATDRSDVS